MKVTAEKVLKVEVNSLISLQLAVCGLVKAVPIKKEKCARFEFRFVHGVTLNHHGRGWVVQTILAHIINIIFAIFRIRFLNH